MQTPDGAWRVEVVRRKGTRWYRIVHGEDVLDWLTIAGVERILDEADVDRRLLIDVDPAGASAGTGDGGFTLIETVVSLALIGTVMAALVPFLTGGLRSAHTQRDRQVAVQLANGAMERVRALARAGLLEGRSRPAVLGQWAQAPEAVRTAYASAMLCDWDRKLSSEPAAACDSTATADATAPGVQAPLPTTPVEATVAGVRYLQNWYVGRCWQPAGANAPCGSSAGGVESLLYMRVIVAVTWSHRDCPGAACVYRTTTLVSQAADPVFNLW